MKAGAAQKAVLNMLLTAIMLLCGLIYRGLMMNMRVSNEKLFHRGYAIIRDISGVDDEVAARADRLLQDYHEHLCCGMAVPCACEPADA